ncbi:hypothetical protein B0H14DRAFT_2927258, partial [Mycena olivaceomarginata]
MDADGHVVVWMITLWFQRAERLFKSLCSLLPVVAHFLCMSIQLQPCPVPSSQMSPWQLPTPLFEVLVLFLALPVLYTALFFLDHTMPPPYLKATDAHISAQCPFRPSVRCGCRCESSQRI